MRTRPAARPGVHALPQPAGDGRRHRLVQGRGLRGRRKAGVRRPLRLRAPRDRAASPGPEVPPHRRGPAQARRRRGHGPRRAGAPPARLRPVAAQPDGAPGRRGVDLRHSLRRLRRRVPRPLPLVPLHPPGRRHDPSRREDRGRRQAGTHRRPVGLRQAPLAAAGLADARNAARPRCRRGAAQARAKGALDHRRTGAAGPRTRCGPGRSGRPGMESAQGRRIRRPALRPRSGGPPAGCRWSRNPDGPTRPPTCPTGEPRRT